MIVEGTAGTTLRCLIGECGEGWEHVFGSAVCLVTRCISFASGIDGAHVLEREQIKGDKAGDMLYLPCGLRWAIMAVPVR
jgi:hypothetical protein